MENENDQPIRSSAILTEKQFREVSECLSDLAAKLKITTAMLVTSSGRIVSQRNLQEHRFDSTTLATLSASMDAAAKEIARLIGEQDHFKMVLQEGRMFNILFARVDDDYSLVVIFESGVALGMVRLFVKRTIARLLPILRYTQDDAVRMEDVFDRRFQSLLGEELDQTLKDLS